MCVALLRPHLCRQGQSFSRLREKWLKSIDSSHITLQGKATFLFWVFADSQMETDPAVAIDIEAIDSI